MSRNQTVVRLDDFRKQNLKPQLPAVRTQNQTGKVIRFLLLGGLIAIAVGFGVGYLLGFFGSRAVAHWVS